MTLTLYQIISKPVHRKSSIAELLNELVVRVSLPFAFYIFPLEQIINEGTPTTFFSFRIHLADL